MRSEGSPPASRPGCPIKCHRESADGCGWAPDAERVIGIAGGVFALLLAVAVMAYAGLRGVQRLAPRAAGRVLPVVAEEV